MSKSKRFRVRMYRHGLGDCFLLSFPSTGGKQVHLVIDSGVLKGTSDAKVKMREVAERIEKETGGKIDVLVVTHEHWDHVSGFTEAREVWERMEISTIWQAWTEDPTNKLGKKLRDDRKEKAEAVVTRFAQMRRENAKSLHLDGERAGRIAGLLGFLGAADGEEKVGGTAEALAFIASHAKKPAYWKPGDTATLPGVSGVKVFVLGPPENEKLIKKSDPSRRNPEVYEEDASGRGMRLDGNAVEADGDQPFDAGTGVCVGAAEYDSVFKALYGYDEDPVKKLSFEGVDEIERLAIALDGDTNNSSLALAFELGAGGPVLLFPADAQVGNWISWKDAEWKSGKIKVRIDDIFSRTVLYKVGHHGSHNATMKDEGLEKMKHRDLVALIPVEKAMAKKKKWKMPFGPLFQRLIERTRGRVILADAAELPPDSTKLTGLTPGERQKFGKMVVSTELYHDIFIDL